MWPQRCSGHGRRLIGYKSDEAISNIAGDSKTGRATSLLNNEKVDERLWRWGDGRGSGRWTNRFADAELMTCFSASAAAARGVGGGGTDDILLNRGGGRLDGLATATGGYLRPSRPPPLATATMTTSLGNQRRWRIQELHTAVFLVLSAETDFPSQIYHYRPPYTSQTLFVVASSNLCYSIATTIVHSSLSCFYCDYVNLAIFMHLIYTFC